MAAPDADFQRALDNVGQHLDSTETNAQAAASVTLALMLQSTALPCDLAKIAARLASLLQEATDTPVKRNVAAALSACLESSDTAIQAAIENNVAVRAVQQLTGGSSVDAGLQLNLLVLLGTLAEASEATLQQVVDAGGHTEMVGRADSESSEQLQEAAVDGLCKVASGGAVGRDAAAAAGAIPRLTALLGGSSTEVQVRALLCLGMLIGGSPERQLELAAAPGAVAAVLRLMRQADKDADCQQIAAGLFKELASNAEAKEAIAQALKEQQAADAETKYV